MPNREAGLKHGYTFWLAKPFEVPDDLDYFLVRATDEILSEVGGNVYYSAARFPDPATTIQEFPYNDEVRQNCNLWAWN